MRGQSVAFVFGPAGDRATPRVRPQPWPPPRAPADMRAPGAPLGIFALESAMDELATPRQPTRSTCGCATTPNETRTEERTSPARNYAPATKWARSVSAGRAARPSRARCPTGASLSGSAWQPACGSRSCGKPARAADRQAYSRPADHHRQAVALTRAPRPDRLCRRRPTIYGFIVGDGRGEGSAFADRGGKSRAGFIRR